MNLDGPRFTAFIESFCRHSTGTQAGNLIQLRDWQKDILNGVFETNRDGLWLHSTSLVLLPRKCGKSQLGSGIALGALIASGEQGAQIFSAAGSRDQARIVFGEAKKMVEADENLSKATKLYRDAIEYQKTGSIFRVLSSDAGLQHGLNPYVAIVDETHVHPNGELTEALSSGRGARAMSMVLHITTPGAGQHSYLHELLERVKRAQEDGDDSYYLSWNPPPDNCDWLDNAIWNQYNPAVGDWITEDFLQSQATELPEAEFRRLHLGQWTHAFASWLPHNAYEACNTGEVIPDGATVILGIDGSWSNDSTALVACTPEGLLNLVKLWEKPPADPHWRVSFPAVEQELRAALARYTVAEVVADPYWLASLLQRLEEEGIPIVEFPTSSKARMVPATQTFYTGVMDAQLTHDGNPALARHISNCRIKTDPGGTWVTKESRGSPNKIDGAVAAIISYDRAMAYRSPNKRTHALFFV